MRTVACFDFDGTLSSRDNVLPFLREAVGTVAFSRALVALAPSLVRARLDERRRDEVKAALLASVLRGRQEAALRELGRSFAANVVARHLREDVLARAEWHRSIGHELVLVSASLSLYLAPVAEQLGFAAVHATELEVGPDGRLTGALAGRNVRGREKVARLDSWLRGAAAVVWAYGDSSGDSELLRRADHPYVVGRRGMAPHGAARTAMT